jgi:hypothetical protein
LVFNNQMRCKMFIVLITGNNNELAYGPFESLLEVEERLERLGYIKKSATHWQLCVVDAYIKPLNPLEEMKPLT